MSSGNDVVLQQPVGGGDVVIKDLQQTDAEFSVVMIVEAFRSKVEHAVGPDKISAVNNALTLEMSTRPPAGYANQFIAWCRGERAGYMWLKFNDTKTQYGDASLPGLSCCTKLRLGFMEYVLSGLGSDTTKDECYLDTLAVSANFRGKGIGKILLDRADSEARERGCKTIYLYVAHDNRAKNLYERHGYQAVSSKEGCLIRCSSGVEKFIRMEKTL